MQPAFKAYGKQVASNARRLAGKLLDRGFDLVTGGTDNHLMLADLNKQGITGKECEELLQSVGIILNRSTIPFETRSPVVTSGVRIGTPAVTTRGMKEREMDRIGGLIADAVLEKRLDEAKGGVAELCGRFPVFAGDE
jgi:glycine hydroxymethyltransferase